MMGLLHTGILEESRNHKSFQQSAQGEKNQLFLGGGRASKGFKN
jgi:hypothetical protein